MEQKVPNPEEGTIKEVLAWQHRLFQEFQSLKELIIKKAKIPIQTRREDFISAWVAEKGYISYSEGSKDPNFNELFPSSVQFHRTAITVTNGLHFKVVDVGKNKCYCLPDFPIERITRLPKTMASAQNPKFILQVAQKVWDKERLNVDEWLIENYPGLDSDERADILDELEKSEKHGKRIKREKSQKMWFSRMEGFP